MNQIVGSNLGKNSRKNARPDYPPPSKISQKLAVTHKFDRSGKKYHTKRFMTSKNNKERAKHQENA
jgi:hypothetical protein